MEEVKNETKHLFSVRFCCNKSHFWRIAHFAGYF